MSKTSLDNFDIASFDLEIEFNKKIAPITKKIDTLKRNHEKKSLESHKDFLSKEKKSKKKLTELDEKALLKEQRITKATENKLKKHHQLDAKLKQELKEYKIALKEANDILLNEIQGVVEELKIAEAADIQTIEDKFDESVELYNEKLATYNRNFKENMESHEQQLDQYKSLFDQIIDEINSFKEQSITSLNDHLTTIQEATDQTKESQAKARTELEKEHNKRTTAIRKKANAKIKDIQEEVNTIQKKYITHYDSLIEEINQSIALLKEFFNDRIELIDQDLKMNLSKLDQEINEIEKPSKKVVKVVQAKRVLFKKRADLTKSYEKKLLDQQLSILEQQKQELQRTLELELKNSDKLEVFLISDQNELKETGDYFKEINLAFKTHLTSIEEHNSEYILKHARIKAEYLKQFHEIYHEFKLTLLDGNQTAVNRLGDVYREIDEINRYLDTAEPLREIEVNRIRVDIEKSEVKERYYIKYAKQEHEKKIINATHKKDETIKELDIRREEIQNNRDITEIKSKELFDKEIEKAKLKLNKANEIYRLRLNSTKLERSLLKSKYEMEKAIFEYEKELSEIDILRENAMFLSDLHQEEENIKTEAMYKIEVINQSLIENTMKLEEDINALTLEKNGLMNQMNLEITKEKNRFEKIKREIEREFASKSKMIDKALEREIKEPTKSLKKANSLIEERLTKFDNNNVVFADFIEEMIVSLKDENINNEQRKTLLKNDQLYLTKAKEYIERMYDALLEANDFIHNLEKITTDAKISSSTSEQKTKRLEKQLEKSLSEHKKLLEYIAVSKTNHLSSIDDSIQQGLSVIMNSKIEDVEEFTQLIEKELLKTSLNLKTLQDSVVEEVKGLYRVLTKQDQDIIDHANANAVKAKALLEQEKASILTPHLEELDRIVREKEMKREQLVSGVSEQLQTVKEAMKSTKNQALEAVKNVEEERDHLLRPIQEHIHTIQNNEKTRILNKHQEIGKRLEELDEQYKTSDQKLDTKDLEAKKILDYESRIYTIAEETAQTRFNERNLKAETAYLDQLKYNEKKKTEIYENHDKTIFAINEELMNLTKEFEKNIFTVRPRLEETIGDAQKIIETEMKNKSARLAQLKDQAIQIQAQIEQNTTMKFNDAYNKMLQTLQYYFDKLRVLKDEQVKLNEKADTAIDENNTIFGQALFELSKNKHETTLEKLLKINKNMIGKEV